MNPSDYYLGGETAAAADSTGYTLADALSFLTSAAQTAGQVYSNLNNAPTNAQTAPVKAAPPLVGVGSAAPWYRSPLVLVGGALTLLVGLFIIFRRKG